VAECVPSAGRDPQHPPGHNDGDSAEFGAQLGQDLRTLRLQVAGPDPDDPVSFLLRGAARLREDLFPSGAGLCPDPRRVAAGLRQPGGVTRQGLLSVGLNLLGPLNTALDLLGPLGQHRVEPGKHVLSEHDRDNGDTYHRPDDVESFRDQRIVLRGLGEYRWGVHRHQKMNPATRPISAKASVKAIPRNIVTRS